MKKILIINGNPKEQSFCCSLAKRYAAGAIEAGLLVDVVHISELEFDPVLRAGYDLDQELEADLAGIKEMINNAEHLVIVFPVWWGSVPAKLKGLFDRVFTPGFAFKYTKDDALPKQLLKGRSARVIITMDTPVWYYSLVYGSPASKMVKKTVLEFCGFSPVKVSKLGSVLKSTEQQRTKFLEKIYKLGVKGV